MEAVIKGVYYHGRDLALRHTINPRGQDKCYSGHHAFEMNSGSYTFQQQRLEVINKESEAQRNGAFPETNEVVALIERLA
jgi:hypothetical protein